MANTNNTFCYLDDILIASASPEGHLDDLNNVAAVVAKHELRLNVNKCQFFETPLIIVGYEVSISGVRPPTVRVTAISEFPLPKTSEELRQFMAMLNIFGQMSPNFAEAAHPVTALLRHNPSAKSQQWTDVAKTSLENSKEALLNSSTPAYPSPTCTKYQLVTDTSGLAAGAPLYQMVDSKPTPLGFFSKKSSHVQ